uniref:SH3 domain-containing protein n=1 Tax=Neogobius melanostomus TaxID=47308 RepID=A0A8C6U110_9GOBI
MSAVKGSIRPACSTNNVSPLNKQYCFLPFLQHHLKKMEGRRLDFDYKKNKEIAGRIEQVSQLAALVQAQLEYHSRSSEILQQLSSKMEDRFVLRLIHSPCGKAIELLPPSESHNGSIHSAKSPGNRQPCCRALYDFEPENEGELGFKEGDVITLTNQIDENWYEGMIHGQSGFFPINYVDILVPLPH